MLPISSDFTRLMKPLECERGGWSDSKRRLGPLNAAASVSYGRHVERGNMRAAPRGDGGGDPPRASEEGDKAQTRRIKRAG